MPRHTERERERENAPVYRWDQWYWEFGPTFGSSPFPLPSNPNWEIVLDAEILLDEDTFGKHFWWDMFYVYIYIYVRCILYKLKVWHLL